MTDAASSHSMHRADAEDFAQALSDAAALLQYAAGDGRLSRGHALPQPLRSIIAPLIAAREASRNGGACGDIVVDFWVAYAQLAAALKPVTATSLAACRKISLTALKLQAASLVMFVIASSIFLFMSNTTLRETSDLMDQQNAAALQLWSDLQMLTSEAETAAKTDDRSSTAIAAERMFTQMVEFSRRNAQLLQTASRLDGWFTPWWMRPSAADVSFDGKGRDHLDHLNVPPETSSVPAIEAEAINQIKAYQSIRDFALGLYKIDTLIYSSLSTYALPTIYALLGAFLYGFRIYARLIRKMEYTPSAAHSARYFIAAIAGLVVGLFGSLMPANLSMPPLAVAFLVGYAVEAFFSRLDDLIERFKAKPAAARGIAGAAVALEAPAAGD